MTPMLMLFIGLVFTAVFLLFNALVVPAFGESNRTRKLLRQRLGAIQEEAGQGSFVSLLRQNYLDQLSPWQRALEELPGMARLRQMLEQAGLGTPAWRIAVDGLVFGLVTSLVLAFLHVNGWLALPAALLAAAFPVIRVAMRRQKRLEQFERELPEAIDLIKRALRAGQPFSTAIRLVADDMEGPVGKEFQTTSADISYGNDLRRALLGLLTRVPSVALMGFVTAVLLQRETGGNLAEVLEQISGVIRSRYRFQRRVRTLSAEGRMSAWVLSLIPVVLAGILTLVSPDYLPALFRSDLGQKILVFSAVMTILGILWMRKIIRIQF